MRGKFEATARELASARGLQAAAAAGCMHTCAIVRDVQLQLWGRTHWPKQKPEGERRTSQPKARAIT
jgi:hypothetical protein